ncbi:MAG: hypothetical protein EOP88_14530 [Verrucomicrobiaceae bacterium]|nr:MAG: hypothetical protein EOP88_14530 [Verrucomicrobiaceae bacterium]
MKTVAGDLIQLAKNGEFDLIVHGCNCMCTMGAGVAKGIKAGVDYSAIRSCFQWIRQNHGAKRVGLPKIGAGLAGGDWSKIATIIDEETPGMDVTLVEFAG